MTDRQRATEKALETRKLLGPRYPRPKEVGGAPPVLGNATGPRRRPALGRGHPTTDVK